MAAFFRIASFPLVVFGLGLGARAEVKASRAEKISLVDMSVSRLIPQKQLPNGAFTADIGQLDKVSELFEKHELYSQFYGAGMGTKSGTPDSVIVDKTLFIGSGVQNGPEKIVIPAGSKGTLQVIEKTLPDKNFSGGFWFEPNEFVRNVDVDLVMTFEGSVASKGKGTIVTAHCDGYKRTFGQSSISENAPLYVHCGWFPLQDRITVYDSTAVSSLK